MPLRNIFALLAARFALLVVSSSHRLVSSSTGRTSAVRPAPSPLEFESLYKHKRHLVKGVFYVGGEGETRTLAPVTRPTPLAGAPRHQLEYFSMMAALMLLYEI